MKKKIIISIIILIFSLIINVNINKYYFKKYNLIINKHIASIISDTNKTEEELIKIINSDSKSDTLEKYGIDINKVSAIKEINKEYNNHIFINNIFIISIFVIIIIVQIVFHYNNKKKINNITKTVKKINNKDYSLDIEDNSEDELSNLKNELYKITLMLKEDSINKEIEKENLKDGIISISHQLKTPLTEMSILIDNMLDIDMDEKLKKEYLTDIKTTIFNMNFLIVTLLKMSKFNAGMITLKKDEIDVSKLIEDVCFRLKNMLELKNIKINLIDNNIKFIGDYDFECEAITNIIKNCIEYSNSDSNIDILVTQNNFYTKIVIKDYGSGIEKEKIKHIFERFYKINNNVNSFGIGLALSKEIIEKDNGFIKVKSEKGIGTTFEIKYMKR